jgi:hypothetical protein
MLPGESPARNGDRIDVRCGDGARAATIYDLLVRAGPTHATERDIDADEACACDVRTGDNATIVAWRSAPARAARRLVTEREVLRIARAKESLPDDAPLTRSAQDRALTLGLLRS